MRILFVFLFLAACAYLPPKPKEVVVEPIPIIVVTEQPDAWEAETIKKKAVVKKPAAAVIPQKELLPPCPPESGDKQKDLLRLLNCAIETADKPLPPAPTK